MTVHVQSAGGQTRLSIDADGGVTIENLVRGEQYCRAGQMTMLVRSHRDPSEPSYLTLVRVSNRKNGTLQLRFADSTRGCVALLSLEPVADGIACRCEVRSPFPVWLAEWSISGVQAGEVLVPALGGQALSESMPVNTSLSFKYPFWWSAQFVVASSQRGGLVLEARETEPRLKLLRVRRDIGDFALSYGIEAAAPIKDHTLNATWYIRTYEGDWSVPVDEHRAWMESAFGAQSLQNNPAVPDWFRQITFVLELWGMRKDRPRPHHTFEEMKARLTEWRTLYDPGKTLLYLPGYAEHGIDSHAPDYEPAKPLGGAAGFRSLVETAHALGYRVMIHTNAVAMTFTHPRYPSFKRHQVVDVFGRPQAWGLDMDGDWLAEPYFAYINPGARAWSDLMIRTIGSLVRRFRIDGVFLDQTLLAFNTLRGPNFVTGMRSHIRRLQHAMPDVLFAGEGLHEHVVAALPMAQIHGIDSIAEVHGLDGQASWRSAHPISTRLFSPYTRFTAHLLTRHPSHPQFALQEEAYARLGVVPALCLYDATQPLDSAATQAMIARARSLSPIPSSTSA